MRGDLTFAALRDGSVSVCRRVQALPVLPAHPGARIVHMMVIGDYLLTLGSDRRLLAWDVSGKEPGAGGPDVEVLLEEGFEPSCMAHPDTYVNKVVLGARDGRMQLWNFVSGKRVYEVRGMGLFLEESVMGGASADIVPQLGDLTHGRLASFHAVRVVGVRGSLHRPLPRPRHGRRRLGRRAVRGGQPPLRRSDYDTGERGGRRG